MHFNDEKTSILKTLGLKQNNRNNDSIRESKKIDMIPTAAIDGETSSPGDGWVTSAPNIIVGLSVNRGILRSNAFSSTVFRPPT